MATKPTDAFLLLITSLHRAVHGLGLYFDAYLDDITQAEAMVLLYLRTAESPTINDVHRAFLHRRSTLTSVLDRMEKRGFVSRATSAHDRRSLTLWLTKAGRKAADAVASALAELEAAMQASRRQAAAAAHLLEKAAAASTELLDGI